MATKRRRKNRTSPEAASSVVENDNVIEMNVTLPKRVEKRTDRYSVLMPHEIYLLQGQIKDFYKEIGLQEGVEHTERFIADIIETVKSNPYHYFYVALDKEDKPLGYIWFYIDRNVLGEAYAYVEQDYVVPEIRNSLRGARVQRKLLQYGLGIMARCGCVRIKTAVRSKRLEDSRRKMGFKSMEIQMTFEGTAEDFIQQNPVFQEYAKS